MEWLVNNDLPLFGSIIGQLTASDHAPKGHTVIQLCEQIGIALVLKQKGVSAPITPSVRDGDKLGGRIVD